MFCPIHDTRSTNLVHRSQELLRGYAHRLVTAKFPNGDGSCLSVVGAKLDTNYIPKFSLHALDEHGFSGYTFGMKTAISVPDDVFEQAERLAKRTKKSRSQVFSEALLEYLARHAPDEVTEAMNSAIEKLGLTSDAFVSSAARHALEQTEW